MRPWILLVTAMTVTATASAAAAAAPTKLLLTVKDMPPGFRVHRPARLVTASAEEKGFDVPTSRYGRISGANVAFTRKLSGPDDADLSDVDITIIVFRTPAGAHGAYRALVARGKRGSTNTFAVRTGAESSGLGLSVLGISTRNAWWRYKNVVVNMSGSYITERPSTQSLFLLVRAQQAKLAKTLP